MFRLSVVKLERRLGVTEPAEIVEQEAVDIGLWHREDEHEDLQPVAQIVSDETGRLAVTIVSDLLGARRLAPNPSGYEFMFALNGAVPAYYDCHAFVLRIRSLPERFSGADGLDVIGSLGGPASILRILDAADGRPLFRHVSARPGCGPANQDPAIPGV